MRKFEIGNTDYRYLLTLVIIAIIIDCLCFCEYIYVRWILIPSGMDLHKKKSRTRLFYVIFNTKEIFSDTLHLAAGIKLQEFILFFQSSENGDKNFWAIFVSQCTIIYGGISLFVFLNTAMESYIEMVEVHPYNAKKKTIRFLSMIK